MRQLNLDFDVTGLGLKPEANGETPKAIELSRRIIIIAVRQYSEQHGGLLKVERGQAKWLQDNLEKAVAIDVKIVDIADDVFGFLRKVFRDTRLPAMDHILSMVEANIDAVNNN